MDYSDQTQQHLSESSIVNARPPSTSYIPRPVSGTSRRTSNTSTSPEYQKEAKSHDGLVLSLPYHERSHPQVQHRTCRTNAGMPPTSFTTPRARLPRSDSLTALAYGDQPLGQNQSEFRKIPYLRSNSRGGSWSALTPPRNVPANTAQLSEKRREITPRTLVKPIQPYLPHSQTTGHLGYSTFVNSVSPCKPPRTSNLGQLSGENDQVKANSGNKKPLIKSKQHKRKSSGQNECSIFDDGKRLSSKTRLSSPVLEPLIQLGAIHENKHVASAITLNLSVNDVANTRRLEEQRQRLNSKRPLFVNTTLANTANACELSPSLASASLSSATYITASPFSISPDPRNVYTAEDTGYWTGRYVSCTDRVRQQDCDSVLNPKGDNGTRLSVASREFELRFDQLERARQSRVFKELRDFCKTDDARKSLDAFESQLKKSHKPSLFVRSYSELFTKPTQPTKIQIETTGIRQNSINNAMNQLPKCTPQTTMKKLSGIVARRGGLIKSKTTGNLTLKSSGTREQTPGSLRPSNLYRHRMKLEEDSKSSLEMNIAHENAGGVYQSETWTGQVKSKSRSSKSFSTQNTNEMSRCVKQTRNMVISSSDWPLQSSSGLTLITDGPDPSNSSQSKTARGTVTFDKQTRKRHSIPSDSTATRDEIKETILHYSKSRSRQSSGQSSGEYVKKVVGAGIREVRKMGRRVSNKGWNSSSDDLPADQRASMIE